MFILQSSTFTTVACTILMMTEKYWTDRYLQKQTGWDIGYPSTPLVDYMNQVTDKDLQILIPGAGNGYEAIYLHENGFSNVNVCDISPVPLKNISDSCPGFPKDNLMVIDFFNLDLNFDLILEQTFFCALHPSKRPAYVLKMKELLKPEGKLVGLLFAIEFNKEGPPWGGKKDEYISIFNPHFEIIKMEIAYNSIPPRKENEYFIQMKKREH